MNGTEKVIIICVSLLIAIGTITELSVSASQADGVRGNISFLKHLLWLALALLVMLITRRVDYHHLKSFSIWLIFIAVLFLVVVLLPGVGQEYHGARRWMRWRGFGFQPSEVAKLALILFSALYLSQKPERAESFLRGVLPLLALAGVMALLILLEPDFGTAVLCVVLTIGVIFLAGARMSHLVPIAMVGGPLAALLMITRDYRCDRLVAFLDPWKYQQGIGYHLSQSLIALGSGGLLGRGLGDGRQKLAFLPEADSDFIFAIIGEEGGFLLAVLVLGVFAGLVYLGMRVARRAPDFFGFLLAGGITLAIGTQALINIAVVTGMAPTKGITLPFISAGGSSIVCFMFMAGVLLNIASQLPDETDA